MSTMPTTKTPLARLILKKQSEWEIDIGERSSVEAFCKAHDLSVANYNNWVNKGKTPGESNIEFLVEKFGPEVYDALGMQRLDPNSKRIQFIYNHVSEERKRDMLEKAEQYLQEQEAEDKPKDGQPAKANNTGG